MMHQLLCLRLDIECKNIAGKFAQYKNISYLCIAFERKAGEYGDYSSVG